MDILKLEKGQYLFKPGDNCDTIYLLTDGLLELSMTINDKHLHLLKKHKNYSQINLSPRVPKRETSLADFIDFKFDIRLADNLKNKA